MGSECGHVYPYERKDVGVLKLIPDQCLPMQTLQKSVRLEQAITNAFMVTFRDSPEGSEPSLRSLFTATAWPACMTRYTSAD
jgi:hypothetical protein